MAHRGRPPDRRRLFDAALALGVAAVQIVFTHFAGLEQPEAKRMDVVAYVLLAAGPAALVVRRRLPSVALTLAFAATLAYALLGYARGPIFLALIIAFFTAVLKERRGFAWTVLALGYGAFLFLPHWAGQERAPSLAVAVGLAAWLLLLAAAAEGLRARRQRAIEEARNRDEEARRRASEERLQIARELLSCV